MKRYGNLYHLITDIENIKLAHINASKGKQKYKEVVIVNKDPDYYCGLIKRMLEERTYEVAPYKVKDKMDKGKLRKLYILPYYPDRIIQHAIMQVLEPIWKKVLIADTFQSIKGRGIHKAKNRIELAMKKYKPKYSLKTDVQKFYPSITNPVLKKVVRKKVKCASTLWLLDKLIESLPGLPIGNYISQYLGNLTLAYVDHKVKEVHGMKMYYRYCDDIVIMSDSKEELHSILSILRYELKELALQLKLNYQVSKISDRGLDFVGFVFRVQHTRIRKKIAKKLVRAKSDEQVGSYFGWAKACRAKGLWNKHINKEMIW